MNRLSDAALAELTDQSCAPGYPREDLGVGIVHLGLGAFHKAHQAFYTDRVLARSGGDWRILGVAMRNAQVAEDINAQDGLFALLEKRETGPRAHVVGSIASALCAATQSAEVIAALCAPTTKIVSTTVTEKGYGIDPATRAPDLANPVIRRDLENSENPVGVLGMIVEALRLRRASNVAPFTVLCCDNLPENGRFVKAGLVGFAAHRDPVLAAWIDKSLSCPSTMVDRITPAQTEETRALVAQCLGVADSQAIETEPFHQWVIEDDFPLGRPAWEEVGAIIAPDVTPYEDMKLRLLNGGHSLLAYAGYLDSKRYVRDAMADEKLVRLVRKLMRAAIETLPEIEGIDLADYAEDLIQRFKNPEIAHETLQIASDGSQKLGQRIFAPAVQALQSGAPIRPFAVATACWIWFCRTQGTAVNDPRAEELSTAFQGDDPDDILRGLLAMNGLLPDALKESEVWNDTLHDMLSRLFAVPVSQFLVEESDLA